MSVGVRMDPLRVGGTRCLLRDVTVFHMRFFAETELSSLGYKLGLHPSWKQARGEFLAQCEKFWLWSLAVGHQRSPFFACAVQLGFTAPTLISRPQPYNPSFQTATCTDG